MRNRLAVACGIVSLALVTMSAQTDVSGPWNMTFNTDQGAQSATLTIAQDGESFSGSLDTDEGVVEFDGGTITGNTLVWVIEIDTGGAFLEISMDGTIDGDEMTGTADFGGYGGGDWTASRSN
jgi:hypothetical protein